MAHRRDRCVNTFFLFFRSYLQGSLTVSCDNGNELTWILQCAIRPLSCHRVLETGLQPANAPKRAVRAPASRENRRGAHWNPLYCDNCTLIGTGLEMTRPAYRHYQECPADFRFPSSNPNFSREKLSTPYFLSDRKYWENWTRNWLWFDPKSLRLAYID